MNRGICFTLLILTLVSAARPADALRVPPGADDEGDYPFGEVIESTTGFRVVAFDKADAAHRELLDRLQKVARAAADAARQSGSENHAPTKWGTRWRPFFSKR